MSYSLDNNVSIKKYPTFKFYNSNNALFIFIPDLELRELIENQQKCLIPQLRYMAQIDVLEIIVMLKNIVCVTYLIVVSFFMIIIFFMFN